MRVLSGKQALLQWVKGCVEGYPNVRVKNFTKSWQDGLAFAALLCNFCPELLDFDSLEPGLPNAMKNMGLAFQAAEEVGIAMLLDAEDVVDFCDSKCIVTQLTQYHMVLRKMPAKGSRAS